MAPLSPDQVLAGLTPILRKVFAEADVVAARDITADDIDGWDSLSHARLIMEVERVFDVELDPDQTADLANVGELADLVSRTSAAGEARA